MTFFCSRVYRRQWLEPGWLRRKTVACCVEWLRERWMHAAFIPCERERPTHVFAHQNRKQASSSLWTSTASSLSGLGNSKLLASCCHQNQRWEEDGKRRRAIHTHTHRPPLLGGQANNWSKLFSGRILEYGGEDHKVQIDNQKTNDCCHQASRDDDNSHTHTTDGNRINSLLLPWILRPSSRLITPQCLETQSKKCFKPPNQLFSNKLTNQTENKVNNKVFN